MISAGNDGNIIFWGLEANMVGSGPLDPLLYLCLSPTKVKEEVTPDNNVKEATNGVSSLGITEQNSGKAAKKKKRKARARMVSLRN